MPELTGHHERIHTMAITHKHTVTLPDGTIGTRTSNTRIYTHVVAVLRQNGHYVYNDVTGKRALVLDGGTTWRAEAWSGRADLAAKATAQFHTTWNDDVLETRVLPCTVVTKGTPAMFAGVA